MGLPACARSLPVTHRSDLLGVTLDSFCGHHVAQVDRLLLKEGALAWFQLKLSLLQPVKDLRQAVHALASGGSKDDDIIQIR